MIYLILLITVQTGVMYAMRLINTKGENQYGIIFVAYVTSAVISYALLSEKTLNYSNYGGTFTIALAAFNGIMMVAGIYYITRSIGVNGTPVSTTFNRLGILIPTVVSILIFNETPSIVQIIGIIIVVISIILINGGEKAGKGGNIKSMRLLLLIFLIGGVIDLNSKIFDIKGDVSIKDHYTLYTFIVCIIVSFILLLINKGSLCKRDCLIGILIGVPNAFTLVLTLRAVAVLPAFIVFPAASAGVILVVNLINYFILKEPLSTREKQATMLIALALALINGGCGQKPGLY